MKPNIYRFNLYLFGLQKARSAFNGLLAVGVLCSGVAAIPTSAIAATYYVDGSASNDSGDGSSGNPKKYITSGIGLMSGGDTLIIEDGTYTGANNMIGDYASPQRWPPNGSAGAYTVIKAANVGQAIIDGQNSNTPFANVNHADINYLRIEGIHFREGSCSVFQLKGNYNKVIRSGFEDGQAAVGTGECAVAYIQGGSSYSLVEDSWVWGKGRIGLYTASASGGANHVIFRRVVVRLDDTPTGWLTAGILFYAGQNNVCQNCIVIDSEPNAGSVNTGAFEITSSGPNHSYYGSIALNNRLWWGFYPGNTSGTTTTEDSIFWDNGVHGWAVVSSSGGTFSVDHVTAGANGGTGFRSYTSYPSTVNVTNSISVNNDAYGFSYTSTADTVDVYGNVSGECESCSITNKITSNPFGSALKYLPRIESGSNLKGTATDGGDIGANILYKIGTSGTLYGESGWNQVTNQSLWPWPDENIWIPKLRAYNASGSGGNRGFAATGQTLTKYIWEYLGNPCPTEICTSDNVSPLPPKSLIVQ